MMNMQQAKYIPDELEMNQTEPQHLQKKERSGSVQRVVIIAVSFHLLLLGSW